MTSKIAKIKKNILFELMEKRERYPGAIAYLNLDRKKIVKTFNIFISK